MGWRRHVQWKDSWRLLYLAEPGRGRARRGRADDEGAAGRRRQVGAVDAEGARRKARASNDAGVVGRVGGSCGSALRKSPTNSTRSREEPQRQAPLVLAVAEPALSDVKFSARGKSSRVDPWPRRLKRFPIIETKSKEIESWRNDKTKAGTAQPELGESWISPRNDHVHPSMSLRGTVQESTTSPWTGGREMHQVSHCVSKSTSCLRVTKKAARLILGCETDVVNTCVTALLR